MNYLGMKALQQQVREGYFEVADGGTIFLDEVGELPLTTQVGYIVLEWIYQSGVVKFKTDVRIVAAQTLTYLTPSKREVQGDLYYRLSTVDILLPPLRDRKDDIHLLFRKFAADFAHKYKMPPKAR
jgi:DNA-binding NtrC family response regulator